MRRGTLGRALAASAVALAAARCTSFEASPCTNCRDARDASPAPPADAARSPCAVAHRFCDDFDRDEVAAGWTEAKPPSRGALDLVDSPISPPKAARLELEPTATGGGLTRTFEIPVDERRLKSFRAAVALRVDAVAKPVGIFAVQLVAGTMRVSFGLTAVEGGPRLLVSRQVNGSDGGVDYDQVFGPTLRRATWARVELAVTLPAVDGTPASVSAFVDGEELVRTSFALQTRPYERVRLDLFDPMSTRTASAASTLLADDVVFDLE